MSRNTRKDTVRLYPYRLGHAKTEVKTRCAGSLLAGLRTGFQAR